MTITWLQVVAFLVFEALIDVLLDRFIKNPSVGLWERFVDWICNREDKREVRRRDKAGGGRLHRGVQEGQETGRAVQDASGGPKAAEPSGDVPSHEKEEEGVTR